MNRLLPAVLAALLVSSTSRADAPAKDPCEGLTTIEIEACIKKDVDKAKADLERYLAEARRIIGSSAEDLAALERAQKAWVEFVKLDCEAAYEHAGAGTIRGAKYLAWQLGHHHQRICNIWFGYIENMTTQLSRPSCPGSTD